MLIAAYKECFSSEDDDEGVSMKEESSYRDKESVVIASLPLATQFGEKIAR